MNFTEEEKKELLESLKGINENLGRIAETLSAVVEPAVFLPHFKRGAAVRVDDSTSKSNNPTF